MALNVATLKKAFALIGVETSGVAAASAFASAYGQYAASAQDAGGNPLVSAFAPALQARLAQAFGNFNGTAQSAASAFAGGFSQFWTGAVFAASPGQPGLPAPRASIGGSGIMLFSTSSSVIFADPAALEQALLVLFQTTDASTATRLAALADALHTATISAVVVLMTGLDVTPPPTGPLPTAQQGHLI